MTTAKSRVKESVRLILIGDAPKAQFEEWEPLAAAIGWDPDDTLGNERRLANVSKYHKDLTDLMFWSWTKLAAVLTLLGLVFAFGREALDEGRQLSAVLAVVATVIAIITAIWAISPRGKVWRRATDSGLVALSIDTLEKECWDMYRWLWHRQRTWKGVERGIWLSCGLGISVLGLYLWNLVPWGTVYTAVTGWLPI